MARSDEELLATWRDGDRKAGSELFDRHFRALRRFFRNKVANEAEADELLQRTFMACVQGLVRFRAEASFRTWLFCIARNVLRESIRERARAPVNFGSQSLADLGAGPSSALVQQREHRMLLEALRNIPLESQVVLELYYWEQLPAKELAIILELPIGTVRSRIRKAKDELLEVSRRLARAGEGLDTTEAQLDDWAAHVREAWGV